jgi:hypothetical protein
MANIMANIKESGRPPVPDQAINDNVHEQAEMAAARQSAETMLLPTKHTRIAEKSNGPDHNTRYSLKGRACDRAKSMGTWAFIGSLIVSALAVLSGGGAFVVLVAIVGGAVVGAGIGFVFPWSSPADTSCHRARLPSRRCNWRHCRNFYLYCGYHRLYYT